MRKFIGNVNGVTFDDEFKFNEAAKKALLSLNENTLISSYYTDVEDKKTEVKEPVKLSDLAPTTYQVKSGYKIYDLTDKVVNLLKGVTIENAQSIAEEVKTDIKTLEIEVHDNVAKVEQHRDIINTLEDEINESKSKLMYNRELYGYINKWVLKGMNDNVGCCKNPFTEPKKKEEPQTSDKETKEDVSKRNLRIIEDAISGFSQYLHDIGFWGSDEIKEK